MEILTIAFILVVLFSKRRMNDLERRIGDLESMQKLNQSLLAKRPAAEPAPVPAAPEKSYWPVLDAPAQAVHVAEQVKITPPERNDSFERPPVLRSTATAPRPAQVVREPVDMTHFEMPEWIMRWLTGGKLFVTLGVLLLFIGSAMLFTYMARFVTIPIEARFIAVALGAIGMIGFGGKQMGKRRDYGLYMQGGGLGLLFITVFAAFRFYSLISPTMALIMLITIGAATFVLSVRNDAMVLSVLAVTGGFLAPILTSTGGGSHIALFGYYLGINLVIFGIAWKKSWRALNTIGFLFTFAIGALWGGKYYVPEFYASVQAFLIAYFLLYTGIGLLFATREAPRLTYPVDTASIFGVPLIGSALQFGLVHGIPNGAAISCVVLGMFYAGLYVLTKTHSNRGLNVLSQPFCALCMFFFTMAVPFAFSQHTTAMLWAVEGAALIYVAQKSQYALAGIAGMIVLGLSNIFMLAVVHLQGQGQPFFNTFYITAVVLSVAHIAASHMLRGQSWMRLLPEQVALFSIVGLGWWFGAGVGEIIAIQGINGVIIMPILGFFSVCAYGFYVLSAYVKAPLLDWPVSKVMLAITLACIAQIVGTELFYHPMQNYGSFALPVAFAVHYVWLWQSRENLGHHYSNYVLPFIILVLLGGFQLGFWLQQGEIQHAQKIAGWLIAAALGMGLLALPRQYRFWPVSVVQEHFLTETVMKLAFWAFGLGLYTLTQPGAQLGAYIPLFNAVEFSELAALAALSVLTLQSERVGLLFRQLVFITGIFAFGVVTCMTMRVVSAQYSVPYFSAPMWAMPEVMTALTILWTAIAMGGMIISSRKGIREIWLLAAGLLGVVIIKLFAVDLANIGTLSRIISFMGVGMLSMVLGYLSPMPPKERAI